jgi:type I restriction enzyme S subunit
MSDFCNKNIDGWRSTVLGEITKIQTGKLDANAQSADGQYPFFTCGEEIRQINHFAFDTEAVILAGNGNFNVKWYQGKFNAYQRTYVIEPNGVNGKWLFYAVQYSLRDIVKGNRGSVIRFIRIGDIVNCPLLVPPLDEQRRIVAEIEKQFTRLDAGVAALQRVQLKLKRYRASVLKSACDGRLVPTESELARAESRDYESAKVLLQRILTERREKWNGRGKYKEPAAPDIANLPELPNGWVWAKLEQLAWSSSYGTSAKCSYNNSGSPVLRIPNIAGGRIDLSDVKFAGAKESIKDGNELTPGDLLIIRTNGSRNLIGRSAVVQQEFAQPTNYASYLIRFRLIPEPNLFTWIATIWDSGFLRTWIEQRAATSAGQHNISMTVLNDLPIPLPPAVEQKRIVQEVDRRLSVIHELELTVEINSRRAMQLRQAILKKSFSN